jgi:hypothetical protein
MTINVYSDYYEIPSPEKVGVFSFIKTPGSEPGSTG